MTSLITGATGFIGQSLLRKLCSLGETVIALSRNPPLESISNLVDWRPLPRSTEDWSQLLRETSIVYHFAWSSVPQASNEDPLTDASENILGTLRLLDAARKRGGLRIVFPSSGGTVYGTLAFVPASEQHDTQPRCAYGVSKLSVEKYLRLYHELWDLDCVALRISNAYGPGQKAGRNFGAIATFVACAVNGNPITVFGDGTVIRDYLYIDDLIEAIIAAGNHRGGPIVMNVGSGVGRSLNDIILALRTLCAGRPEVNYVSGRSLDVPISVLDVSLAKTTLNWRPRTSLQAGLESTLGEACRLLNRRGNIEAKTP